ncbi:MAG: DUF4132 domain-containing protein [Pseudomonadota bacterium]
MLDKILGKIGQTLKTRTAVWREVQEIFAKPMGARTADKMADYVEEGQNSSILADLSQQQAQTKWRGRFGLGYVHHWDYRLMRNQEQWRVDQMMRLGEIFAALDPISYDYGYFGSKKSPDWLRHTVSKWMSRDYQEKAVTNQPIQTLIDLCDHGGPGAAGVIDIIFGSDPNDYHARTSVQRFAGTDVWMRDSVEPISEALPALDANARAQLASTIGRTQLHALYLPVLLDLATGTAKGPRAAANQALTGAEPQALEAAIEERFGQDSAAKRAHLIDTAAITLGERAAPLIGRLRDGEKSTKVIAAMDRVAGAVGAAPSASAAPANPWQKDGPHGYTALGGDWVEAPPAGEMPSTQPIPKEALELLKQPVSAYNANIEEQRKRYKDVKYHWTRSLKVQPVGEAIAAISRVASGDTTMGRGSNQFGWLGGAYGRDDSSADAFFDHPGVSLRHLVRIATVSGAYYFGALTGQYASAAGRALQRRIEAGADIRVVAKLWKQTGGADPIIEHLTRRWYYESLGLPDEAWPMVLDHFPAIDEALGLIPQTQEKPYDPRRALDLLELLPKVPERYRARLLILANDSGSKTRETARKLLIDADGIEDAIALQLDDGKQDVRAQAAQWLAQRGATSHIAQIRQRLKKEKSEKARAQMISALERLGDDTSDFFVPEKMVAEAEKGLAKKPPKGLEWFPFDALPQLQWADGAPVDPKLPRYWVTLATRLKEAGGNALIDLWLDRLAPGDAHKLGWMVLTGWIAEDTKTPSEEDGNAYAKANVDQRLDWNRKHVKRYPSAIDWCPTDYDTVFAQLKRQITGQYLGSAADSKGMLALASRVEGHEAGPRIRTFLKDHGARVSQAKALLDVLANNGSPAALQVLLQTADRLKQKSVQAHAGTLIEAVAERRGWTPAELADRTVPTGGLDEDGTLDLECGEGRLYTARLDEEDKLALFNPAGKEVKALPPARHEEEKAEVAASKKALSRAKKEVKQVVAAQTDRLREAMCLERAWSSEDWVNFVAGHPILGRLAARLVWLGVGEDGAIAVSFRPLGDGTYSDAEDEDVEPGDFETIKLAHSTLLDNEAGKAWSDHLADYDVTPLFAQFGRELPEVTAELAKKRDITDREGWMIETFQLRGIAGKLGYQRGPAEDGGWFYTYTRNMREAKLVAQIEFTGNGLPEENRPAALISLSFRRMQPDGRAGAQVALGDVPEVLLAETWRDYHDIAAKGSGYHEDWQKKSEI